MSSQCDALVLFGASGDLAYKKIFPALQAMCSRGILNIPVICLARRAWTVDQLRTRARESVENHVDCVDSETFEKLAPRLSYVHGDYNDPATFDALRKVLGGAEHPER